MVAFPYESVGINKELELNHQKLTKLRIYLNSNFGIKKLVLNCPSLVEIILRDLLEIRELDLSNCNELKQIEFLGGTLTNPIRLPSAPLNKIKLFIRDSTINFAEIDCNNVYRLSLCKVSLHDDIVSSGKDLLTLNNYNNLEEIEIIGDWHDSIMSSHVTLNKLVKLTEGTVISWELEQRLNNNFPSLKNLDLAAAVFYFPGGGL